MSVYVVESRQRRSDGSFRAYLQLRQNLWDRETQSVRQRVLAHLGKERQVSRKRIADICSEYGLEVDDVEQALLRKGLEIVEATGSKR